MSARFPFVRLPSCPTYPSDSRKSSEVERVRPVVPESHHRPFLPCFSDPAGLHPPRGVVSCCVSRLWCCSRNRMHRTACTGVDQKRGKRHAIPVHDERRQLATENNFGSIG